MWKLAQIAWKMKWLLGAEAVDQTMFRGRGTEAAIDVAKKIVSKGTEVATDSKKREEFSNSVNQSLEGARQTGDKVVAAVKDPVGAVVGAVTGDGKKDGGGILDFFKDDDGSVSWTKTLLGGAAAWFGGSKLKKLFGGDNKSEEGSGLFGGLFKFAALAAIGVMLYKYKDQIVEFGKGLVNKFKGVTGSNETSTPQSNELSNMQLPAAPPSNGSLGRKVSLGDTPQLGQTFDVSAAPAPTVKPAEINNITAAVNKAAAAPESNEAFGTRKVAELNTSLASNVDIGSNIKLTGTNLGDEFGSTMSRQQGGDKGALSINRPTADNAIELDTLEAH